MLWALVGTASQVMDCVNTSEPPTERTLQNSSFECGVTVKSETLCKFIFIFYTHIIRIYLLTYCSTSIVMMKIAKITIYTWCQCYRAPDGA